MRALPQAKLFSTDLIDDMHAAFDVVRSKLGLAPTSGAGWFSFQWPDLDSAVAGFNLGQPLCRIAQCARMCSMGI
jgi:hypothetical protein